LSIDLDAARAARREARGEAPTVTFGGETFALPVELPFEIAEVGQRLNAATTSTDVAEAMHDAMRMLLADDYDRFMALRPSLQDLTALVEGIPGEYGISTGESRASRRSSRSSTDRSRPTSLPSTA